MPPDYPSKNQKEDSNPNHLENMEEKLYSRGASDEAENSGKSFFLRQFNQDIKIPVRSEWAPDNSPTANQVGKVVSSRNTFSLLKQILVGSIILFLVSVGIAVYVFWGNHNVVSTKNILININTPVAIGGGEKLPVEVSISNQNNVELISADVVVEYGDGGRQPDDLSKELRRYRESLGSIAVGAAINKKYEVVFFGEEGESKDIKVSVEYRVAGSNAIFTKNEKQTVRLSSAPVSVSIDAPAEASIGENVTFTVTISANASQAVQHLMVSADYPFGWTPFVVEPKPTNGNNVWDLGSLKPGVTRILKISGQFSGNEGEERAIRFLVGSPDRNDNRKIGVVFLSKAYTVKMTKPFIELDLVLGGSSDPEYVTSAGSPVRADIVYRNNLDAKVTNVSVEAKLLGSIFDRKSVSATSGFFRSLDNTVVWNQTTKGDLAEIEPGESGALNFTFDTLRGAAGSRSPSMGIQVTIIGSRITSDATSEQVKITSNRTIKISSELSLTSKILYSTGPFLNSGPVPPKAESETTYTIVLSLTNSSSDLSNVEVETSVPIYVNWLGKISPENENIKYNPVGGKITWDVGDLQAGGGVREAAFQISFLPSISQIDQFPIILNQVSASGYDNFSSRTLNASDLGNLDISLRSDPAYAGRGGPVTK